MPSVNEPHGLPPTPIPTIQMPPAFAAAGNAASTGNPNLSIGAGGGGNPGNWGVGSTAAAGANVWQSGSHSVGVGVSYQQAFGRSPAGAWSSQPNYAAGVSYKYKF